MQLADIYVYRYNNKVSISNANCTLATSFILNSRMNECSCESVEIFYTENVSTGGDSNPQPSDSFRMLKPFELSGPDICCLMFSNTGSGGIVFLYFVVKLTSENLTVRGHAKTRSHTRAHAHAHTHTHICMAKDDSLVGYCCLRAARAGSTYTMTPRNYHCQNGCK